jgi:hypothetical protein
MHPESCRDTKFLGTTDKHFVEGSADQMRLRVDFNEAIQLAAVVREARKMKRPSCAGAFSLFDGHASR